MSDVSWVELNSSFPGGRVKVQISYENIRMHRVAKD